MIGLALLAATEALQPQQQAPKLELVRQATATVRIVSGARITAAQMPPDALVTTTEIRGADGSTSPARLIEFQ